MLRQRLRKLFDDYDPALRQIVSEVIEIEQAYISMQKPRVSDKIDKLITRIAQQEVEPSDTTQE
jgi:hypothetical protein